VTLVVDCVRPVGSGVSPRGVRGPSACGRRGRPDRRGCASGDGNHGYGCGAGCSAGRCACSRVYSDIRCICRTVARLPGAGIWSKSASSSGSRRQTCDRSTVRTAAASVKLAIGRSVVHATRRQANDFIGVSCTHEPSIARFTVCRLSCTSAQNRAPQSNGPALIHRNGKVNPARAQPVDRRVETTRVTGYARPSLAIVAPAARNDRGGESAD